MRKTSKNGTIPNIYKIAELAGVSVTTVSRVINGNNGVGEETRKKILDIIQTLNFKPKIMNNSIQNIAIFYGYDISGSYVLRVINGINDKILGCGLEMLLIPVSKLPKDKNEFKVFCHKRKIVGALFVNIKMTDTFILSFEDIIPIVTIGSKLNSDKFFSVRSENYKGAYDAVTYLIKMGHRKIAFFVSELNVQDHYDRLSGYKDAFKDADIEVNPGYILDYANYSDTSLNILVEGLMTGNERPTAAFICDDQEVIRISSILNNLNIKIPEDLSIVGFDDYVYSEHFTPPLTTVRQPIYELGLQAAQIIVEILSGSPQMHAKDIMLGTKLMIRKSVIELNM